MSRRTSLTPCEPGPPAWAVAAVLAGCAVGAPVAGLCAVSLARTAWSLAGPHVVVSAALWGVVAVALPSTVRMVLGRAENGGEAPAGRASAPAHPAMGTHPVRP